MKFIVRTNEDIPKNLKIKFGENILNGKLLFIFAIVFFTNACTTAFHHPPPIGNQIYHGPKHIGNVATVIDARTDNLDIDKIFEKSPRIEIQKLIEAELLASGIFSQMISGEVDFDAELKYLIKPTLKRMEWFVPNYEDKQNTMSAVAGVTGLLGILIYSAIAEKDDVYGYVDLEIELYDLQNEKSLFIEIFNGEVKKSMGKLSFDTIDTKSEMIGLATQNAIEKFKEKLKTIF